jgi:hypothetical protein
VTAPKRTDAAARGSTCPQGSAACSPVGRGRACCPRHAEVLRQARIDIGAITGPALQISLGVELLECRNDSPARHTVLPGELARRRQTRSTFQPSAQDGVSNLVVQPSPDLFARRPISKREIENRGRFGHGGMVHPDLRKWTYLVDRFVGRLDEMPSPGRSNG